MVFLRAKVIVIGKFTDYIISWIFYSIQCFLKGDSCVGKSAICQVLGSDGGMFPKNYSCVRNKFFRKEDIWNNLKKYYFI